MSKSVYLAFSICLMVLTAVSCHQDPQAPSLPYIAVDQGTWQDFTHEGGFREVVVKTNRSWSIECDADWLAFDPQSAEVEPGQERGFRWVVFCSMEMAGESPSI